MPIDKSILEEYVATANSGKYKSFAEINEKFPELKDYDANVLEEYVATSNSGKYKSWDEINGKFPELFTDPVKKKAPSDSFYKNTSEALGLKPKTLSQSPLKTAEATTPSVSTKPNFAAPTPRLSAEEQVVSDISKTKGYVREETEGTQLDRLLANQKAQNIPLEKQMTSKDMVSLLDLMMPSTQGAEANQAFEAIFKKQGREGELQGIDETKFKQYLSATGIADKYNNARMDYDLSDKERYSVIQKFNQSQAGTAVQDLNIVKARLNTNPAYKQYEDLTQQAEILQEQIGDIGITKENADMHTPDQIAQYNDLLAQYHELVYQANTLAEESGISQNITDLDESLANYGTSLLRSRLLIEQYPNLLKQKELQDAADAQYEERRARFKQGDLSVLPTSAMYVGASALNSLNRNFYNSLASLIDNFGKLNDNTYSLGDWASKGLTELADNTLIVPHKEFSKSGYNVDGYIVTKDKNGALEVYDKDYTPVQVDSKMSEKFSSEYDQKESTGANKETMYDFFSLAPQLADQFVTMYSLVGGGQLAQKGLQSFTKKAISQNTGLTASSYLMTYEDYKKTAIDKGLSDTDAHLFASISAMATSLLENISPNENIIPKGQTAKALEAFTSSVGAPLKTRAKAVTKALVVEPTKEILQEISQIGGDILVETGANAALGKDVFDAATNMDEIRNTAMLTYGTTALAQLPASGMFNSKDKKEWWQWASKDVDKLIEQVQQDVDNGLYSQEKGETIVNKAKAWSATQGKIPAEVEDIKRAEMTPLLIEKNELIEKSKDLDSVFKAKAKERINAIDQEIIGIMNKPISEFVPQEETSNEKEIAKEIETIKQEDGEQATTIEEETIETPSSETITDTIVSDGSATPTTVESTEISIDPNIVSEIETELQKLPIATFQKIKSIVNIDNLLQEGMLKYVDSVTGKPCARHGSRGNKFTKGGKWKIVKDLKGYKTHEDGGVDLTIGKDGVNVKNGKTMFKAEKGLLLPMENGDDDIYKGRIAQGFTDEQRRKIVDEEEFLASFIQSPKYKEMLTRQIGDGKEADRNISERLAALRATRYSDMHDLDGELKKQILGEYPVAHTLSQGGGEYDVYLPEDAFTSKISDNENSMYVESAKVPLHEMTHRSLGEGSGKDLITPQAKQDIKNIYHDSEPLSDRLGWEQKPLNLNPNEKEKQIIQKNINSREGDKSFEDWSNPSEVLSRLNSFRRVLSEYGVYDPKTENIDKEKYLKFKKDTFNRIKELEAKSGGAFKKSQLTDEEKKELSKLDDLYEGMRYINDNLQNESDIENDKIIWMLNNLVKTDNKNTDGRV